MNIVRNWPIMVFSNWTKPCVTISWRCSFVTIILVPSGKFRWIAREDLILSSDSDKCFWDLFRINCWSLCPIKAMSIIHRLSSKHWSISIMTVHLLMVTDVNGKNPNLLIHLASKWSFVGSFEMLFHVVFQSWIGHRAAWWRGTAVSWISSTSATTATTATSTSSWSSSFCAVEEIQEQTEEAVLRWWWWS